MLFAAWTVLKPDVKLIGPDIASVIDTQPGPFRFTAGAAKKDFAHGAYAVCEVISAVYPAVSCLGSAQSKKVRAAAAAI